MDAGINAFHEVRPLPFIPYTSRFGLNGFFVCKINVLPARVVNVLVVCAAAAPVAFDPYEERDHRLCEGGAA